LLGPSPALQAKPLNQILKPRSQLLRRKEKAARLYASWPVRDDSRCAVRRVSKIRQLANGCMQGGANSRWPGASAHARDGQAMTLPLTSLALRRADAANISTAR